MQRKVWDTTELKTRTKIIQQHVKSILLYGAETWMEDKDIHRIQT